MSADAWQRHQHYLRTFSRAHRGSDTPQLASTKPSTSDADVVRQHHRFLWDEEQAGSSSGTADTAGGGTTDSRAGSVPGSDGLTWEQRLAKRYWQRLFKEYVIADLSRYREGGIGLRWRTEQEVLDGRGQFSCGNKSCNRRDVPLNSYELHFGYMEHGEAREALVKVRLNHFFSTLTPRDTLSTN
jgi:protein FRA10AC1